MRTQHCRAPSTLHPVYPQPTRIRRVAARVLLLWLLTLGAGIVHACLVMPAHNRVAVDLTTQVADATGTAAAEATASAVADGSNLHAQHHGCCPDDAEDSNSAAPDTACVKLCADESHSVPAAQHVYDPGMGLDLAPLPTLGLAVALSATLVPEARHGAPLAQQAQSIPISFLRLTL
jgi:hypothetical protein